MVIETLPNQFLQVRDLPGSDRVWLGIKLKRVRGEFVTKTNPREILVRKLGTRLVARATA